MRTVHFGGFNGECAESHARRGWLRLGRFFLVGFVVGACSERKSFPTMLLPDISTLKISELKAELHLYGIKITGLSEKQDLISALKIAHETLPRPITTHREPELPTPPAKDEGSKAKDCDDEDATTNCCAECGNVEGGDVSLKLCKSCVQVKYCGAMCQKKHWATHKKDCKLRAAELRDEALFKDPPPLEDCPICFLPMPTKLVCCVTLPDATVFVTSYGKGITIPILDFENKYKHVAKCMDVYYPCCGKNICKGCVYSFRKSGNDGKCPFCNSNRASKSQLDVNREIMKRVEANDPGTMRLLAEHYIKGEHGFPRNETKAMELFIKSADLGSGDAHHALGNIYEHQRGNMKKAKFHYEEGAMLGDEMCRSSLGRLEFILSKHEQPERALKHWTIAASGGCHNALHHLSISFGFGRIPIETMKSIVAAYNNSCKEMRSEARDAFIRSIK